MEVNMYKVIINKNGTNCIECITLEQAEQRLHTLRGFGYTHAHIESPTFEEWDNTENVGQGAL
jgi:hypothetical protein